MRCFCLCLAPAIDVTVRMGAWPTDGAIIKDAADTAIPGGKAINVARWLAKRGAQVACGGVLGEDNAALFAREMRQCGIADRFVRVAGATRVNEMFVTPQGAFKVNRSAQFPFGGLEPFGDFTGFDMVIMSGSLPKGWPEGTYRVLALAAKKVGATVVLDTSGAALVEGVKAHPDVIKPNADECAELVGFAPRTPDEFVRATELLRNWSDYPIISDGASGCWFNGTFVPAPKVEVLDTTAAGDTLLAEWCFSRDPRLAVAAGSAACTMPGGTPPAWELVDELARSVGGERM